MQPISGQVTGMGNSLQDMVNILLGKVVATPVQTPTLPKLDFTFPSSADINAKWAEFLDRASKDPDIVNYYDRLLKQAEGDANLAKDFLERDYTMGVRQTTDTLGASLEKLGLTSLGENEALQDTLNKRGIALTQDPNNPGGTVYAGGGRAGTEVGRLSEGQRLRKEAEVRSSSQNIEKMGLTREKGLTNVGQGLQQYGTTLQKQKSNDILNRAEQGFNVFQQGQNADLVKAQYAQQNGVSGTSSGGKYGTGDPNDELTYLSSVESSGDLNPAQQTRIRQLRGEA